MAFGGERLFAVDRRGAGPAVLGHASLTKATTKDQISPIPQIDKEVGGHPAVDMTVALAEMAGLARGLAEALPSYQDLHCQLLLLKPRAGSSPGGSDRNAMPHCNKNLRSIHPRF